MRTNAIILTLAVAELSQAAFGGNAVNPDAIELAPLPMPVEFKSDMDSPVPFDRDTVVTVAGKCCESGDLIQEHTKLQPVQAGDILAVLCTGAYNYSMASNYNRVPRPAIVLVSGGSSRLAVRRESFEDMMKNEL